MHARWSKLFVLLFSLAFASGCALGQPNWQTTPDFKESDRRGFQESDSGNEYPSANESSTSAQGKIAANQANPAQNRPGASDKQANSSEKLSKPLSPAAAEPALAIPPLGTAHATQRPTEVNAPTELRQANAETAFPVDQQSSDNAEAALMSVVAELEAMGELDPQTKQQLITDLRQTKPALWQPMLGIYRLALAKSKRDEGKQSPVPPTAQATVSDHLASTEHLPPGASNRNAAIASMSANQVPPARQSAPANTIETIPAAEIVTQRPSPLRPQRGAIPIPELQQSDNEVQPTQYEEATAELVYESTLPRKHNDRAVRLAAAATKIEPASRKAGLEGTNRRIDSAHPRADELADWQAYLEESILLLEEDTAGPARTAEEVRRQAELRLLYLAGGDREAALRPIEGITTTQQEFWSEVLFSLATYLDSETLPDGPRRAAEARRHLEAAVTSLGELSTLTVRNIAFCSKVNSYGIYETYQQDEFEPGQQVLLYAELENFKCEETPEGFITSVRSSYQIFDARGVRVESHDFATTEETCRNRRRDFFMRYFVDLPTRIYDGDYTLKITIEDMKGQTSGEASIPFRIKEHKEPKQRTESGSRSGPGGL